MNITRDNYEEFFMLYADNELTAQQRNAVEAFIAVNTDLERELQLFQSFKIEPDEAIVFNNKAALLKHETASLPVSLANCEAFFVLYADGELNTYEQQAVEDFVYHHPQVQAGFALFCGAKLQPDQQIIFEGKQSLYRKEKDERVIPVYWWRLAAAAALVLAVSGLFWFNGQKKAGQVGLAANQPAVNHIHQSSPAVKKDAATSPGNASEPADHETTAAPDARKANAQAEYTAAALTPFVAVKKQIKQKESNLRVGLDVIEETNVLVKKNPSDPVISIDKPKNVVMDAPIVAAAMKPVTDQQMIVLNPDENNRTTAEFASLNDGRVEILNTSVNTKSSLRGFLRKASRLIAKKTDGQENGNRKEILIGGFEIAVR